MKSLGTKFKRKLIFLAGVNLLGEIIGQADYNVKYWLAGQFRYVPLNDSRRSWFAFIAINFGLYAAVSMMEAYEGTKQDLHAKRLENPYSLDVTSFDEDNTVKAHKQYPSPYTYNLFGKN